MEGRGLGVSPSHPSLWACLFIEINRNHLIYAVLDDFRPLYESLHICMSVYGCFWLWVLLCVLMNVLILMHVHMYAVVGMWVVVGGGGWW
jgi:hypothetical protein